LYLVKTDLATAGVTNIGPSSPWAWATGDRLFVYGKYQMASRYS
jgi:hypothetical protein